MEGDDVTYNNLDFYKAAGWGDVEYVEKALANKIDPNWQNPDWRQYTALHTAARFDHSAVVRSLKAAGANMNLQNEDGETAIYMAAYAGKVDAVTALLDCGADIEIATYKGITPVMNARPVEVVEALIDANANLEHVDDSGQTALHWPVLNNYSEIVKLLLKKGLDPRKQDKKGMSPVDIAKEHGYHDLVTIMVGEDVEITELDLFNAAKRGDVDYVAKALAKKTDPNWQNPDYYHRTALHIASECNNAAVIKMLLGAGANKDIKDKDGCTPIFNASIDGSIDAVTMLLDCGANIEIAKDGIECTPVMIADQLEVVKLLIDAHANLRKADIYGRTALHLAAGNNKLEKAKLLLQKGIDAMQQDEDGLTAAEYGRKYDKHDVADIIDNFTGTTSTAPTKQSNPELDLFNAADNGDVEYVDNALANKTDPNWQNPDKYHRTGLHQACRYDHSAVVRSLLTAGANKDLKDDSGETPLFMASNSDRIDIVNILIDCGADINIATDDGVTPIMTAESVEVAEALIDAHANLNSSDEFGRTALHYATWCDRSDIVPLLLQKGIDAMKQDKDGLTAADYARNYDRKYKEQELADIIDSFTGTTYHQSNITELDLFNAAGNGDVEYVDRALANNIDPNWVNPDGMRTALHQASRYDYSEVVRLLVAAGANTDLQDEDGKTAIFLASNYGNIGAVTTLIYCGADINIATYARGMTPIMMATHDDHLKVVEALIDAHANLRQIDTFGNTALIYAVWSYRPEQVQLMLHKGINEGLDPRKQNNDGESAADIARNYDLPDTANIIDSFITSTSTTGQPSTTVQPPTAASTDQTTTTDPITTKELDLFYAAERGDIEYVDKVLANKTDPSWQHPERNQNTALHRASRFNHSAVIRSLKAAGADTDLQNEDGETPIYLASKLGQIDAVTTLIDCGANIDITTPGGKTPIMVAWPVEVVDALMKAAANIRHADNLGRTALHWAVRRDQFEKVTLLLQNGIDASKKDITGLTAANYARNRQDHKLLYIIDSFTAPTEKPIPESATPDYDLLLRLLTGGIVLFIAMLLYRGGLGS